MKPKYKQKLIYWLEFKTLFLIFFIRLKNTPPLMIKSSFAASFPMYKLNERRVYNAQYVRSLFDSIAQRYDFLNHLLSAGIDILWRKKAIKLLKPFQPEHILDVATGTADFACEAAKLASASVVGIDISPEMLKIGKEKVENCGLNGRVRLVEGQAEHLGFTDESFDAVTVAFGVRNFASLEGGLEEMYRVLKKNGVALILEFSKPRHRLLGGIFQFYFRRILPIVGGIISNNKDAYRYLPSTVGEFPAGTDFLGILHEVGFSNTIQYPLTFGIATIYIGLKK